MRAARGVEAVLRRAPLSKELAPRTAGARGQASLHLASLTISGNRPKHAGVTPIREKIPAGDRLNSRSLPAPTW